MSNDIIHFIASTITVIVLIIIVGIIIWFSDKADDKVWNNGYCDCGGKWTYEQAVGHRNSTSYMYVCDKCGKRYEFNKVR